MERKLIAIDLDGSLLKDDCTISEANRKAILRAMEEGHLVIPSTGRGYRNSRYVLQEFPVMPYYINANGTTITQGQPEKPLFQCAIPYETGCEIYKTAMEYHTFIELYHGMDAYDSYQGCKYMEISGSMKEYREQLLKTNIHMESLDDFVIKEKHAISKFHIVCATLEEKEKLFTRLAALPGIYPISTASHNIEVADAHWSKKNGLEWLCEHTGFKREQVIAIGDSANDYESICWAGLGVAMGNASEQVKQAADVLTKTNEEDGVAHAIWQYVLG